MGENPQEAKNITYVTQQISPQTQGDSAIALWLEIIFGFFGFMGMGHVYAGRIGLGIILMVGWWVYQFVIWSIAGITAGLGLCLLVPLQFAIPIISGIQARTYMQTTGGKGSWSSFGMVLGGGCLFVIIATFLIAFLFIGLGTLGSILNY